MFSKITIYLKSRSYTLLVYNIQTAMNIIVALEKDNISNISIEK